MKEQELLLAASAAREHAYCPYSHFSVGAALLCDGGRIYVGCNIENASYGATICAERAALAAAVAAGERHFLSLALVGGKEGRAAEGIPPCGICLQALSELCGPEMPVLTLDGEKTEIQSLGDLLPKSFQLWGHL